MQFKPVLFEGQLYIAGSRLTQRIISYATVQMSMWNSKWMANSFYLGIISISVNHSGSETIISSKHQLSEIKVSCSSEILVFKLLLREAREPKERKDVPKAVLLKELTLTLILTLSLPTDRHVAVTLIIPKDDSGHSAQTAKMVLQWISPECPYQLRPLIAWLHPICLTLAPMIAPLKKCHAKSNALITRLHAFASDTALLSLWLPNVPCYATRSPGLLLWFLGLSLSWKEIISSLSLKPPIFSLSLIMFHQQGTLLWWKMEGEKRFS